MKKRLVLDGDWRMAVLRNEQVVRGERGPIKTCDEVEEAGAIDAKVPGNFELDLQRAGKLEDPFYGENPLKMQEYEDRHIYYAKKFYCDPGGAEEGSCFVLEFDGMDTIGDVYLNGELIGHGENMFIPQQFEAKGLRAGENELVVHLLPACIEARKNSVSAGNYAQKYNYETLRLRKASHMFGWDIMPRLVSAGLYRSVFLSYQPPRRIRQAYLMTKAVMAAGPSTWAGLELFYDLELAGDSLDGYVVSVTGECGASRFFAEQRLWFSSGKIEVFLPSPQLWWPKGYGQAALYEVTVSLTRNGRLVDTVSFRAGIRTVKLLRTGTTNELLQGDFHFEINGKPVFLTGTNWVPADAYHSRDRERIPAMLDLVEDLGCNVVRCWGGNLYEEESFFEFCDEKGIVVWQDFAMACGVYPIDPDFQRVIREEAVAIVRKLRQHPSLILWSGDNECDQFMVSDGYGRDPNGNRITREVLPDVVAYEDPARPYLPSSPYYSREAAGMPDRYLPENHLWGPRDYYKGPFYRNALSHFVSETGYHGCPAPASLRKFLSPEKLWPWQNNREWLLHAASPETENGPYLYRIELMAKQIRELFGSIPENLEDFALASQISQAEAKKYFIERMRYGQPQRNGIIWWNLMDGWPQFSDAVVDYYFAKKLAYYYIKNSQAPLVLTFTEPEDWKLNLVAVNNSGTPLLVSYRVEEHHTRRVVLQGTAQLGQAPVSVLEFLPYSMGEKKLYVISWEARQYSGRNHYLAGNPPFDLAWYRDFLKAVYPKPEGFESL